MVRNLKSISTGVPRLLAVVLLLGWPQISSTAGTWSVISLPQQPGQVSQPRALATDAAGNLYVADKGRIQQRDTQGNWSVIAPYDPDLGQPFKPIALAADGAGNLYVAQHFDDGVFYHDSIRKRDAQGSWSVVAFPGGDLDEDPAPSALAADIAGNLYVAHGGDYGSGARIQKRDAQGNWSILATWGSRPGQVSGSTALAVDATGELYVADQPGADYPNGRIQKRDAQGNWSVIATQGASALAVDAVGTLYVADNNGIRKRDVRGNWSVIATEGWDLGQVRNVSALAVDAAGNLYVAEALKAFDIEGSRIQKRDAQGSWSVIATYGRGLGQISLPSGLAVDIAGSLYVADTGNDRVQEYTAFPGR